MADATALQAKLTQANKEKNAFQKKLKQANKEISVAQTHLAQAKTKLKQASKEISATQTQLAQAKTQLTQANAEKNATQTQLAQAKTQLKQANAEKAALKAQLENAARSKATDVDTQKAEFDKITKQNEPTQAQFSETLAQLEKLRIENERLRISPEYAPRYSKAYRRLSEQEEETIIDLEVLDSTYQTSLYESEGRSILRVTGEKSVGYTKSDAEHQEGNVKVFNCTREEGRFDLLIEVSRDKKHTDIQKVALSNTGLMRYIITLGKSNIRIL